MNQELLDKIAAYKAKGFEVPDEDMIKTPEQIAGIREACKINTAVLDEVAKHIKAGMTTAEIDKIVYDFTVAQGATPAPLGFCGFPKSVCTSINDQVCHGIPSEHDVLKSGDIVNVDVSTIYNGYYADASRMFMIGKVNPKAEKLVKTLLSASSAETVIVCREFDLKRTEYEKLFYFALCVIRDYISLKTGSNDTLFFTDGDEAFEYARKVSLAELYKLYNMLESAQDDICKKNASANTVLTTLAANVRCK